MEDGTSNIEIEGPKRGKPTPRGSRGGRGRGRGRGSNPQSSRGSSQRERTSGGPTFQERAAQVRSAEGAPVETPGLPTIPLAQLSQAMDQYFPCAVEPTEPPESTLLDCSGFAALCGTTYEALVSTDDKLERLFSEPEFILCCSQVLAKHVLRMRTMALHQIIPGQEDFFSAIPLEMELPTPIVNYLEGLGIVRHPDGVVCVPNIVLPRTDIAAPHHAGMLPSLAADAYTTTTHWELNSAMIQFGMLARAIRNAHTNVAYGTGNALTQLNPNIANLADDAHYLRPACLPRITMLRPMHRDRIGKLTLQFVQTNGLMRAIGWNPQMFQHFELFLQRSKNVCSMSRLPVSTAGTPAWFAWASPLDGDDVTPPNAFLYFATVSLSNAEAHAARLFRYRQDRNRTQNCSEPNQSDAHAVYNASHVHLQNSTLALTAVPAYSSYLGHFVRHFMKGVK